MHKEIMSLELADEELAEKAAKGDFYAFEELVRRYSSHLFKFSLGMLNNYEDAKDVLQLILIQIHTSLSQHKSGSTFKGWIFKIARNKCLDQLRKRSVSTFSELDNKHSDHENLSVLEQLYDTSPLPEEVLERDAIQHLLKEAIMLLPERYRAVVALRYTSDLSFNEIGHILNISEGSAKTFFQRAKIILRNYLKDQL